MIALAAVIAAAAAVGVGAERRLGARAERGAEWVLKAMLWVLLPPVVFLNIAALHLDAEVGAGVAYGYVTVGASLLAAYLVGTRLLRLPRAAVGSLMLVAALGNTGYLGLPFTAALLGRDELSDAIVYDTLVSTMALITIGFSVGAAFGTGAAAPRERLRTFFTRNPPLWACLAGFTAPNALAPHALVQGSQLVVFAILPLGFFVVGVTLAAESEQGAFSFPPALDAPVAVALALKLVLAPAVALALSALVLRVPEPYLTQPAMASAINTIVVAHAYGLDRRLAAGAIAWSTTIVVAAGLAISLL